MIMIGVYIIIITSGIIYGLDLIRLGLLGSPTERIATSIGNIFSKVGMTTIGITISSMLTSVKRLLQLLGRKFLPYSSI
jgi:hypothetical protein